MLKSSRGTRRTRDAYIALFAVFLILLSASVSSVQAQSQTSGVQLVLSTNLTVYSDGVSSVNQTINSQNQTAVNISLLSAQVGDVLALDQKGLPVSYELNGASITIYSLGASQITLLYDMSGLTSKQSSIWTIAFNSPFNLTLSLPQGSTILSVSGAPNSISTVNGAPTLALSPASWSISYGLPLTPVSSSSTTSTGHTSSTSQGSSSKSSSGTSTTSVTSGTSTSQTGTSQSNSLPTTTSTSSTTSSSPSGSLPVLSIGVTAAIVVVATAVYLVRRRPAGVNGQALRPDDIEMLRFVKEKGGRVTETEIRARFTLPRTSAWRQAKRLEKLGYVRITKIGSQNQVELIRPDFGA